MNRWGIALLAALAGSGCTESGGGTQADAGVDVAVRVDRADDVAPADADDATVVDAMDVVSAMDADDAATDATDGGLPRDTSDVVEDLVTDLGPPPCPSGQTRCGESCVDTGTSVAHCGMCGMACPAREGAAATCVAGMCRFVCNAGVADCDGDASNGCEADLSAQSSCGACGTACALSSRCVRGVCAPCSALAPMAGGRAEVADAAPLRLAGGSFTIEAWLFATGYPNRCQNAIATKRGSAGADGWFFSVTGNNCGVPTGRLYYQVSGGNDPSVVANTAAPTGRWFHAAATYDAGTRVLTLWQDGAAVGSATLPPPSATTAAPMYIGNDSDGQANAWSGYIDELRISSGVRYGGTFTAPAQLEMDAPVIALWRFQESTGVAVDASPAGYVARLVMADRVVSTAICRP